MINSTSTYRSLLRVEVQGTCMKVYVTLRVEVRGTGVRQHVQGLCHPLQAAYHKICNSNHCTDYKVGMPQLPSASTSQMNSE